MFRSVMMGQKEIYHCHTLVATGDGKVSGRSSDVLSDEAIYPKSLHRR
jgi:hypothetical protein